MLQIKDVLKMNNKDKTLVWHKGRTNLYYLCTELLGMDLTVKVHLPVCNLFVHKNPDLPWNEQDEVKSRLLLDPRGHYKTTIDCADAIQWVICFPNIRIKFWSGSEDLVAQILDTCRKHFIYNEVFKAIYPEHAIEEKDAWKFGNTYEFTTPARTDWTLRDPTFSVSTINSTSTGGHSEISKYDDVVTPKNSNTKDLVAKTIRDTKQTFPIVMPGGYRDFIGTTYAESDLYAWCQEQAAADPSLWKVHKRGASTLTRTKDGSWDIAPDCRVLFTIDGKGEKKFDYKTLMKERREMGDELFFRQYYNRCDLGAERNFSREMLERALLGSNAVPFTRAGLDGQRFLAGRLFQTWDLAFSERKAADYNVGICGFFDSLARLFIVDMVRGKWPADQFVSQLVSFYLKWKLFLPTIGIEKIQGAHLIEPALRAVGARVGVNLPIDWLKVPRTTTKRERIFGLLPLLKNDKLFICRDMEGLDVLMQEFSEFPRARHDDIPDACAMLLNYQPSAIAMSMTSSVTSWRPKQIPDTVGNDKLGWGMVG